MVTNDEKKISYRVSLIWVICLLLALLFIGFSLQGYFNFKLIKEQQTQIENHQPLDIKQALTTFIISDALFLFLIAFCFIILLKIIIRPIKELTELCDQMREGQLITKTIESDIEEINQLIISFNQAISDLKEYKIKIEDANRLLEGKVEERTAELEKLTATLEEKIKERTKQLSDKIEQLEKFERITVGRELKMMEQKKEIDNLHSQLDKIT